MGSLSLHLPFHSVLPQGLRSWTSFSPSSSTTLSTPYACFCSGHRRNRRKMSTTHAPPHTRAEAMMYVE